MKIFAAASSCVPSRRWLIFALSFVGGSAGQERSAVGVKRLPTQCLRKRCWPPAVAATAGAPRQKTWKWRKSTVVEAVRSEQDPHWAIGHHSWVLIAEIPTDIQINRWILSLTKRNPPTLQIAMPIREVLDRPKDFDQMQESCVWQQSTCYDKKWALVIARASFAPPKEK